MTGWSSGSEAEVDLNPSVTIPPAAVPINKYSNNINQKIFVKLANIFYLGRTKPTTL